MSVTQTSANAVAKAVAIIVDIPADHRLVIDVPSEVPAGRAVLTFTPAEDREATLKAYEEGLIPAHEVIGNECPICKAHNYMPNAKTIAVIEEARAMAAGEIPSTLREFNSIEEMWEDLMRDDPDDDLDDPDGK